MRSVFGLTFKQKIQLIAIIDFNKLLRMIDLKKCDYITSVECID